MLRLPAFTYAQPGTLAEALARKRDAGPAGMYVAGGTDLYPNMKRRQQEPAVVISLMGIPELREIRRTGGPADGAIELGTCVTLDELCHRPAVRESAAVVAQAAGLISTPLLRNMGTLGGNLCLDTRCNYYDQTYEWRKSIDFCMKKDGAICWVAPSSPRCWAVNSSDLAPVALALGAEFSLVGSAGERTVSAAQFYRNDGIAYVDRQPDEILTAMRVPVGAGEAVYEKLRRRGAFDFPVLGVAAWVRWDGDVVVDGRLVLGAVASLPLLVEPAGAALIGTRLSDDAIAAAAEAAFVVSKPMDNTDFDLSWRKQMTRVYVTRALRKLRVRPASPVAIG